MKFALRFEKMIMHPRGFSMQDFPKSLVEKHTKSILMTSTSAEVRGREEGRKGNGSSG